MNCPQCDGETFGYDFCSDWCACNFYKDYEPATPETQAMPDDADSRCLKAVIEDAIAHGVDPMAFEEHHEPCCKFDPSTGQLRCQCKCHGTYKGESDMPPEVATFLKAVKDLEWNEDVFGFAHRLGVVHERNFNNVPNWVREKFLAFRELANALRKFDPETLYWLVMKEKAK